MEDTIRQRQIAYKVKLSDIALNSLIKQEGWNPNYILLGDKKVSRVNIIGAVISATSSEQDYIIIDDGNANIIIRKFETQDIDLMKYDIGNLINVIGKIREFNNEK